MSISKTQGIFNFSKMKDLEKAYLVKLSGTMIAAVIMGIISGLFYEKGGSFDSTKVGFLMWFLVTLSLTYWIKYKYDMGEWNDKRIFRHGVFVGFLYYIFFWTVSYNFMQY